MKVSPLISAAEAVLLQGSALLKSVSDEDYRRREDGPYGSSLGAHYRHVLDHFLSLMQGLGHGSINYDRRARNPELENAVGAAVDATEELIQALHAIPADVLPQECTVVYSVGYGESEAQAVRSTIAREVMFCVGHAIHHFAIVKLLCLGRSVALPCEFGIAPSTLKYLETHARH